MKKLLIPLSMLLIIMTISVSFVTPVFAWTGVSTGWEDCLAAEAEFAMFVTNYYENNTSSSVKLGWSYLWIDFWGDEGVLTDFTAEVYPGNGTGPILTEYIGDITLYPDDFHIENLDLDSTTYAKSPGGYVIVRHTAAEGGTMVFNGMWHMWFYTSSISSVCYP